MLIDRGLGHLLALVGCGKLKRRVRSAARDLYTGPLFLAARAWAERNADHWLIASALQGLVHPATELDPYDRTLEDMSPDERDQWGFWCQVGLARHIDRHDLPRRVAILAGSRYVKPLLCRTALGGLPVEVPLAGLGIGERLRWFKKRRAEQPGLFDVA
jgi:hypothetical protein